jgi:hypothetical protein
MSFTKSEQKETDIKEILKRIDDLTRVLKIILDDLGEVSRMLRAHVEPHIEEVETRKLRSIDDVHKVFPQDLSGLLYFEETDDYIIIKPKQYLGSENFAKIASIIREHLKGEYVSHGKESHFRVPKRI